MSIENIKKLREMTGAGMLDVKKALDATNQNIDEAVKWLRKNGISKAAKKSNRVATEGVVKIVNNKNKIVIAEVNSETDFVASNEKFISEIDIFMNSILKSKIENFDDLNNLKINKVSFKDFFDNLTAIIGEKISLRRFKVFNLENKVFSSYLHSNSKIGVVVISDKMDLEILKDISMHIAAMNPEYLSKDDVPQVKINDEIELAKKELENVIKGKPEKIQKGIIDGKVNKNLSEIILLEQQFVKDNSKKIKDLQKNGKILEFIRFEVGEGMEKKEENFAKEVEKAKNISK